MDLVSMVEESWSQGRVMGAINSSFLSLIPKFSDTSSFFDHWPISLCNITYKLISKITMEHIKGILSSHITREQSGFLHNKMIHDDVATAKEVIHSIHTKKMSAIVMKVDLWKAYDYVD